MIISDQNENFHLSLTADLLTQFVRTFCYLYHDLTIIEHPVITPNVYIFEKYRETNPEITEKWEIYAEVVRDIMCECSGLEKSDMTLRDSFDYENLLLGSKDPQLVLGKQKNI